MKQFEYVISYLPNNFLLILGKLLNQLKPELLNLLMQEELEEVKVLLFQKVANQKLLHQLKFQKLI